MRSFIPSLLLLVSVSTVLSAPVAQSDEVLHARGDTPDYEDSSLENLFTPHLPGIVADPNSWNDVTKDLSDPFKGIIGASVSHQDSTGSGDKI